MAAENETFGLIKTLVDAYTAGILRCRRAASGLWLSGAYFTKPIEYAMERIHLKAIRRLFLIGSMKTTLLASASHIVLIQIQQLN